MKPTPKIIEAQIVDLDRALAGLEQRAAALAFDAVAGDAEAAATLARLNSEADRMRADRIVLQQALKAARAREAEAHIEATAADRARSMDAARAAAARLTAAAERADALIAEWKTLLAELSTEQDAIRAALAAARALPTDAVVGRSDLQIRAADLMQRAAANAEPWRADRPLADIATTAWGFILNGGNENGR